MPPILPQLVPMLRRQALLGPRAALANYNYTSAWRRGYAIDNRQYRGGQPPAGPNRGGQQPVGPNQDALPGVNEEAGRTNEIMGESGPDMSNARYANEIMRNDEKFYQNAPEVMRQEYSDQAYPSDHQGYPANNQGNPADYQGNPNEYQGNPNDYQGYQVNPNEYQGNPGEYQGNPAEYQGNPSEYQGNPADYQGYPPDGQYFQQQEQPLAIPGDQQPTPFTTAFSSHVLTEHLNYPKIFHPTPTDHVLDPNNPTSKYPLPSLPIPATSHLHHRYSPLIDQVVNLFMRDGKKATAQKNLQKVLDILRTKPPPKEQTKYNLIANHPALVSLPRNPCAYLQTAIDSVAPLMRLRSQKAAGGFSNQVPEPLNERQRRRTAVKWMLTVSSNKKDKMRFAERFAEEVVAVVEGKSAAWDRKLQIHKTAVGARSNVKVKI